MVLSAAQNVTYLPVYFASGCLLPAPEQALPTYLLRGLGFAGDTKDDTAAERAMPPTGRLKGRYVQW
jgi:hypothetical protein